MISFKDLRNSINTNLDEAKKKEGICWKGYKRKPNTKPYSKGSCIKEEKTSIGINVKTDHDAGMQYADLIVDGHKTLESRNSDTLRPYVNRRIAIVRTGEGPAKAIGEVTIGEPMVVGPKEFRSLEHRHLVPAGSAFDIKTPTKHLYPLHNPVRYDREYDVGHGIISRKINEDYMQESNVFTDARMNAIKAGKKSFTVRNKKYNITGDTSDELSAGVSEDTSILSERGQDAKGYYRSTEDGAGLTAKGAKKFGVKTAVTTPPSKLDPKGEAAGRRRSFCARMSGMRGPMKDEKGRPTRKAMSLRRWNCN